MPDSLEHCIHINPTMRRPVALEATRRLLELALAARSIATTGVEPGDRDVHESLQEVALSSGRVSPFVLELLVCLEVRAGSNQLQPALETHRLIIGEC